MSDLAKVREQFQLRLVKENEALQNAQAAVLHWTRELERCIGAMQVLEDMLKNLPAETQPTVTPTTLASDETMDSR